ncbi:hypothetical protein NBO_45g0001 [Nosema bombycis CQ1]|uniref:Uncharacterized protein n=1 Tax=Nosema bombycis (strain CQ1 / CVCC 102059) TaxID=578461 RepID=R0MMB1_NOSB1|nr:hypothetical protein NBO_45g0001 [Nosema bombycis CQ1]|eukprot:EOB13978.1 hypothetical protein NBO_45g0001 [Nosema bombycis CQ1]
MMRFTLKKGRKNGANHAKTTFLVILSCLNKFLFFFESFFLFFFAALFLWDRKTEKHR